jgi:protein-disulfide isomerase
VRIVWKNLPLDFHKDASLAAVAALAANDQGKFWEYHDKLFEHQPKIEKQNLLQYARELKLDMNRFEQALNTLQGHQLIEADKGGQGSRRHRDARVLCQRTFPVRRQAVR